MAGFKRISGNVRFSVKQLSCVGVRCGVQIDDGVGDQIGCDRGRRSSFQKFRRVFEQGDYDAARGAASCAFASSWAIYHLSGRFFGSVSKRLIPCASPRRPRP